MKTRYGTFKSRFPIPAIIPAPAAGSNTIEEILAAYPYLEREDIAQSLQYAAWRVEEREIALAPV